MTVPPEMSTGGGKRPSGLALPATFGAWVDTLDLGTDRPCNRVLRVRRCGPGGAAGLVGRCRGYRREWRLQLLAGPLAAAGGGVLHLVYSLRAAVWYRGLAALESRCCRRDRTDGGGGRGLGASIDVCGGPVLNVPSGGGSWPGSLLLAAGLFFLCRAADALPVVQARPATALRAGVAQGIFGGVVAAARVHTGARTRFKMKVSASKLTA